MIKKIVILMLSLCSLGFCDNTGKFLGSLEHKKGKVITVGKSGADYTSVVNACTAASNLSPSSTNPVIIIVHPGVYTETSEAILPAWTSIIGFGRSVSIIQNSTVANTFVLDGAPSEDYECLFMGLNIKGTKSDGQGIRITVTDDTYSKKCLIHDCYIYGTLDGVHSTGTVKANFHLIANASTIESDGDALTLFTVGGSGGNHVISDCIINVLDDTDTAYGAAVKTGTTNNIRLTNCVLNVEVADSDGTDGYGIFATGTVNMYGGSIIVTNTNGTGDSYGVKAGSSTKLTGVILSSSSAGGSAYDISTTNTVIVSGSQYDRTKLSGDVRDASFPLSRTLTTTGSPHSIAATQTGTIFQIDCSSGAVHIDLPAATAGIEFTFNVTDGTNALQIDPSGSEYLKLANGSKTSAGGDYITNDTAKAAEDGCRLRCVITGVWEHYDSRGTWTEE